MFPHAPRHLRPLFLLFALPLLGFATACGGSQAAERAFDETRAWASESATSTYDGRVRLAPASAPLRVLEALPANPVAFVAWDASALVESLLDGSWFGGMPLLEAEATDALAAFINDSVNLLWEQEWGHSARFDLRGFDEIAVAFYADPAGSDNLRVVTLVSGNEFLHPDAWMDIVDPYAWLDEELWKGWAPHGDGMFALFGDEASEAWYRESVHAAPDGRLGVAELLPNLHDDALFVLGLPDSDRLPRLARLGLYQFTGGPLRSLGVSLTTDMALRLVTDAEAAHFLHSSLFLAREGIELGMRELLMMFPQPEVEGVLRGIVDALFSRVALEEGADFASIDVPGADCGAAFSNLVWYGGLFFLAVSGFTTEVPEGWRYSQPSGEAVSATCLGSAPTLPPLDGALLPWLDPERPEGGLFLSAHLGGYLAQGLPSLFGLLPFALSEDFVETHLNPRVLGLSSWADPRSSLSVVFRTDSPGADGTNGAWGMGAPAEPQAPDALVRLHPTWSASISPFMLSMMGIDVVELEGVGEVLRMGFVDEDPAPSEVRLATDVQRAVQDLLKTSWLVTLMRPSAEQRSPTPMASPIPGLQPLIDKVWFPHIEYTLVVYGPEGRVTWQRVTDGEGEAWDRWNEGLAQALTEEAMAHVPAGWDTLLAEHLPTLLPLLRDSVIDTHRVGPWIVQRDDLSVLSLAMSTAILGGVTAAAVSAYMPWLMDPVEVDGPYPYEDGPPLWEEIPMEEAIEEIPEEAQAPVPTEVERRASY